MNTIIEILKQGNPTGKSIAEINLLVGQEVEVKFQDFQDGLDESDSIFILSFGGQKYAALSSVFNKQPDYIEHLKEVNVLPAQTVAKSKFEGVKLLNDKHLFLLTQMFKQTYFNPVLPQGQTDYFNANVFVEIID